MCRVSANRAERNLHKMNREDAEKKQNIRFSRKEAREFAMQTVFQMDAQKELKPEALAKHLEGKKFGTQSGYVKEVLGKLLENIEEVDAKINAASDGWSVERMAKTDAAIIRLATSEMLYREDVPTAVAINEAVSLSKLYGTEQSPKFVNAVLGKIAKTL